VKAPELGDLEGQVARLEAEGRLLEVGARFRWSRTSRNRIETAHPHLGLLFDTVLRHPACPFDLTIPRDGGGRSEARQGELVEAGRSETMDSGHMRSPAMALDVIPYVAGKARPEGWARFHELARVVFAVGFELGIPLTWGGHWTSIPDGAHWELSRAVYAW